MSQSARQYNHVAHLPRQFVSSPSDQQEHIHVLLFFLRIGIISKPFLPSRELNTTLLVCDPVTLIDSSWSFKYQLAGLPTAKFMISKSSNVVEYEKLLSKNMLRNLLLQSKTVFCWRPLFRTTYHLLIILSPVMGFVRWRFKSFYNPVKPVVIDCETGYKKGKYNFWNPDLNVFCIWICILMHTWFQHFHRNWWNFKLSSTYHEFRNNLDWTGLLLFPSVLVVIK